jgi:hypothetical protein
MLLLVAVVGEAQVALEVRMTFTISPLFKVELLNVGLLVPTLLPFTGVAVKVTDVPGQILFALGATVTDGTGAGFTVIVTVLLAVVGEAQVALEVRVTFTISPLFKVELLNVGLLVPTLLPFTCHW